MANLKARLTQIFVQITTKARILVQKFLEIATDPVKLWNFGRALTLAIPSSLFLLPFRVVQDDDGLYLLALRGSRKLRGVSYIFNTIIAIRLLYFTSLCLNPNFQLNYDGKLTADAMVFGIGLLIGYLGYLCHFTLLYSAGDFVYLYNTVVRLNRRFSGNF